jgi:ATP-dependent DNA helicase RecG|tara:strand:- start:51707 stop:53812 length:2106 start_codon:yes stop_codon:yes gene_type:complete
VKENYLFTPIDYLKGIGPNRASLLKSELKVFTYNDLLNYFPFRYIDRTKYHKISELEKTNSEVQIIGKFINLKYSNNIKSKRLIGVFSDGENKIEIIWFRAVKWIEKSINLNENYVVYGKINWFNNMCSIVHPEIELLNKHKKSTKHNLLPIYSSTETLVSRGITNKLIREFIINIFENSSNNFNENLSKTINERYTMLTRFEAFFNLHFPKSQILLAKAQFRLKYEEFFFIQLQFLFKNLSNKNRFKGFVFSNVGKYFNTFYNHHLDFKLTNAQKRVVKDIRKDFSSNAQMNRLLQGDVGSGKTIVAILCSLIAIDNNFQTCLIAPTEILAQQHFKSISDSLSKINLNVKLLTGSTSKKERITLFEELKNGLVDILIGTHAVLEDKVVFKNLGFAIIDEQHRFGVAQRSKLWKKNTTPPHILVMTATPIPRTLAMSVYGDLDISIIDELPPGRKKVNTVHRTDRNRLEVFKFIRNEISKGRQIYVVYPLIEESKVMDYKDLIDGYESIIREFPVENYQISILHGRMKPADKTIEMDRFKNGQTQIMVSTTVIEVGVNIPNASVMVIESSERFGLSQLHQLRGRVGRGSENSYCILMSKEKISNEAKTRIKTMTSTNDGFRISEVDMELRGPGNLLGTQQSGLLNFKIADIIKDRDILELAREDAKELISIDPSLKLSDNKEIKKEYFSLNKNNLLWKYIS